MQTTEFIWFNGKFVPWDDAKVHVLTHALHYASGTFEGLRFYQTDDGSSAIFRLVEHVDRLLYSAQALHMALPYSKQQICDAIVETVARNNITSGYLRPLVFYGYQKMGVNPIGNPVDMIIACWPWGAYHAAEELDVKVSQYIRLHPKSTVIDAKLSANYINCILPLLEIQGTHYHEVLLLDHDHYVSEGSSVNFFMVKNGVIYTPTLSNVLPGITRDFILILAKKLGYQVLETQITLAEVYAADEAFFSGTAGEITPIRSLDDKLINGGGAGPISLKLKAAYQDVVHGRDKTFSSYLTYVKLENQQHL